MMRFDRITLGRQAKELGFVRDTFEKVCRLADVLSFMESDGLLADSLALKGGTAINLTIFDLPRLSVDIDLDFSKDVSREAMLAEREQINEHIQKYMAASGYTLSLKSKQYHALDSFVYEYVNAGGMKDNLKIEINYMLRCHVLPVSRRPVYLPWNDQELTLRRHIRAGSPAAAAMPRAHRRGAGKQRPQFCQRLPWLPPVKERHKGAIQQAVVRPAVDLRLQVVTNGFQLGQVRPRQGSAADLV